MKRAVYFRCSLERGLLRLYSQATAERRFEVAEHLLCALERMATVTPEAACAVEEAYLSMVPHRLPRVPSQEGEPMTPGRTKYRRRVAVRGRRM